MAKEETTRTTIRLSQPVHLAAKSLALHSGLTFEELVERALKKELADNGTSQLNGFHAVELYEGVRTLLDVFQRQHAQTLQAVGDSLRESTEWSPLLAYRFLQSAPAAAVIKDKAFAIVWCNVAYERMVNTSLEVLRGKTAQSLGLVDKRVEKTMRVVLKGGQAQETVEEVHIQDRGASVVRVQRFVLYHPLTKERYLGDLTFDLSSSFSDVNARFVTVPLRADDLILCQPFLEACSSAIAIKDRHRRIVWCDSVYLKLSRAKALEDVVGKAAEEIFDLGPAHSITANDQSVVERAQAMYVVEQLPRHPGPRSSLRFPIVDRHGQVQLIGTMSGEFDLATARYVRSDESATNG